MFHGKRFHGETVRRETCIFDKTTVCHEKNGHLRRMKPTLFLNQGRSESGKLRLEGMWLREIYRSIMPPTLGWTLKQSGIGLNFSLQGK